MHATALLVACAGLLLCGGCGTRNPVASDVKSVNLPLPSTYSRPDPAGAPPENMSGLGAVTRLIHASVTIPARLQGRWGLSPAACISTRGGAKGLLVVSADALHFYESDAVPSSNLESDPASIGGDFHFSGDGEEWTKFEALKRKGDKLTRTETNPAASYTYAKC